MAPAPCARWAAAQSHVPLCHPGGIRGQVPQGPDSEQAVPRDVTASRCVAPPSASRCCVRGCTRPPLPDTRLLCPLLPPPDALDFRPGKACAGEAPHSGLGPEPVLHNPPPGSAACCAAPSGKEAASMPGPPQHREARRGARGQPGVLPAPVGVLREGARCHSNLQPPTSWQLTGRSFKPKCKIHFHKIVTRHRHLKSDSMQTSGVLAALSGGSDSTAVAKRLGERCPGSPPPPVSWAGR